MLGVTLFAVALTAAAAAVPGGDKVNLLMIISDQHRFDAMGAAGNEIVHTPVLDKLAQDGVRFASAYSICPVCCPSRTSMLAGRTPEQTQVRGNGDIATAPRAMTYDRVLLANGWRGEYKGKYHSPYNYTRDENGTSYYSKPVQWLNGKGPVNAPGGVLSLTDAHSAYLDAHEPLVPLARGQLLDGMYRRPYWADVADLRYDQAFNDTLLDLSKVIAVDWEGLDTLHALLTQAGRMPRPTRVV